MLFTSNTISDTEHAAQTFAEKIVKEKTNSLDSFQNKTAKLIGLIGDLGAGKTSFTKALGKALGINIEISSPTFVIFRRYELANLPFKNLFHFDLYRLDTIHELEVLGWKEIIENPENIVLVEWPDTISEVLRNKNLEKIHFVHKGEDKREITFEE